MHLYLCRLYMQAVDSSKFLPEALPIVTKGPISTKRQYLLCGRALAAVSISSATALALTPGPRA